MTAFAVIAGKVANQLWLSKNVTYRNPFIYNFFINLRIFAQHMVTGCYEGVQGMGAAILSIAGMAMHKSMMETKKSELL